MQELKWTNSLKTQWDKLMKLFLITESDITSNNCLISVLKEANELKISWFPV